MKINEYIIAASLKTEIRPPLDLSPLLIELKRIGNNLNQITTNINAGAFRSADFHEVVARQRALCDELRRITEMKEGYEMCLLKQDKYTERWKIMLWMRLGGNAYDVLCGRETQGRKLVAQ